ncbi:hypothetical protein [Nocardia sienata]|uniref:hypothetical protein n=1 Tax=Nocardia sienata TaxID=248552 RepID=UPI0012EEC557|nr:hypothetical protein [Nocardia sienata]
MTGPGVVTRGVEGVFGVFELFERESEQGSATYLLVLLLQLADSRQQPLCVRMSDVFSELPANR